MIDIDKVNALFDYLEIKYPQFSALFVIGKSMMLQRVKLNSVSEDDFLQYKINWEAMTPASLGGLALQLMTIGAMALEDAELIVNPENADQKAITMRPDVLYSFVTFDPSFIAVAITATKELGIRADLANKKNKTAITANKDLN